MTKELRKLAFFGAMMATLVGCQTTKSPSNDVLDRSAKIMNNSSEGKTYSFERMTNDGSEIYVQNSYTSKEGRPVVEKFKQNADGTFVLTRETNAGMEGAGMSPNLPKLRKLSVDDIQDIMWSMKMNTL